MIVKLRLKRGKPVSRRRGKNRHLAHGLAALLMPVSLAIYALVAWRLASDMGFASEFPFRGILSHWQVWLPIGVVVTLAAVALNRYGQVDEG